MTAPTSVYRYYDATGTLIYVGITSRGMIRQNEHNSHAAWWRFVRSQDVDHFDTREDALRRETHLITRHRPPFNTTHNPDASSARAAYLERIAPAATRCGHCLGCSLDDIGYGGPHGCRQHGGGVTSEHPEDQVYPCDMCGSDACVYADGHTAGRADGHYHGILDGIEQARHELPEMLADHLLRSVIDESGQRQHGGYVYVADAKVEDSRRAMDASIAAHGVTTLVDEAWKVPGW